MPFFFLWQNSVQPCNGKHAFRVISVSDERPAPLPDIRENRRLQTEHTHGHSGFILVTLSCVLCLRQILIRQLFIPMCRTGEFFSASAGLRGCNASFRAF